MIKKKSDGSNEWTHVFMGCQNIKKVECDEISSNHIKNAAMNKRNKPTIKNSRVKKGQWKRQISDRIVKRLSKHSQESAFLAASVMLCFFNMHEKYLWKEILVKILRVVIKISCVITLWMCGGIKLSFSPKCVYFFVFSDTPTNPESFYFPSSTQISPSRIPQMGKKEANKWDFLEFFF